MQFDVINILGCTGSTYKGSSYILSAPFSPHAHWKVARNKVTGQSLYAMVAQLASQSLPAGQHHPSVCRPKFFVHVCLRLRMIVPHPICSKPCPLWETGKCLRFDECTCHVTSVTSKSCDLCCGTTATQAKVPVFYFFLAFSKRDKVLTGAQYFVQATLLTRQDVRYCLVPTACWSYKAVITALFDNVQLKTRN